ncbi:polysaccharide deacetylase family protein [Wenzhouxiangella sediminis]|nr:polysaccharide deacetylase family protein [Wenzhouxiangella sediminis]
MNRTLSIILFCLMPIAAYCAEGKKLAITIDDLPVASATPVSVDEKREITEKILSALRDRDAQAVGFVNEDKLLEDGGIDANVALLEAWLDDGMELGNHTFGHVGMHETELSAMKAAVLKGEPISRWLSERADRPYRYFRHPFTQTGDSIEEQFAFESFLAAHGYTVAPFTIEHTDYLFSCIYDHLAAGEDPGMDRTALVAEYMQHLGDAIDAFETMSDDLFGRPIPQIWLIHANRINAATLSDSLELFKSRGYEFVTLKEALEDPAYATMAGPSKRYGPSWLLRWARSMRIRPSVFGQPDPSETVMNAFRNSCQ